MELEEKSIAAAIAKARGTSVARLGLRFDRVVQRVAKELRAHGDGTIVVALTAPIAQPAKTTAALQALIDEGGETASQIHGNGVVIRREAGPSKVLLFVHNRDVDAEQLLDDVAATRAPSRRRR